jgi:hypothetical protein
VFIGGTGVVAGPQDHVLSRCRQPSRSVWNTSVKELAERGGVTDRLAFDERIQVDDCKRFSAADD